MQPRPRCGSHAGLGGYFSFCPHSLLAGSEVQAEARITIRSTVLPKLSRKLRKIAPLAGDHHPQYLADGMSEAEILADFPRLVEEDIRATLAFCGRP